LNQKYITGIKLMKQVLMGETHHALMTNWNT